jgi:hypothetical protein
VEPFLLVLACLVAVLLVWVLMRVGAKRRTAGWAWMAIIMFGVVLVAEVISGYALTTSPKTFPTVPKQKAEGK